MTRKLYGYFGHHKCASTWFGDIFAEVCDELGLVYKEVTKPQDFNGDLKGYLAENRVDFVKYSNADFAHVANLNNLIGIHAVRDPRDIIVSAYFSHLKTHSPQEWPALAAFRAKLQQCDQETGLSHEIVFRKPQFDMMRSWKDYHGDNIMLVRFEDATSKSYQSILSVIEFLGLLGQEGYGISKRLKFLFAKVIGEIDSALGMRRARVLHALPAERVLGIVWENEFVKKTGGRKLGQENRASHYRKGIHGDWKNYLTKDHIALIKQDYNDVILQYGYEETPDWEP